MLVNVDSYKEQAKRILSPEAWDDDGAAEDEKTRNLNYSVFDSVYFQPRMLTDTKNRNKKINLFKRENAVSYSAGANQSFEACPCRC